MDAKPSNAAPLMYRVIHDSCSIADEQSVSLGIWVRAPMRCVLTFAGTASTNGLCVLTFVGMEFAARSPPPRLG